jgi:hypothetical protein
MEAEKIKTLGSGCDSRNLANMRASFGKKRVAGVESRMIGAIS